MADMRERLIDILFDLHIKKIPSMGELADYLIENGVIVLDADSITIPTKRECIETFANMPIDEVLQLVQAKQEGKLLVLPCKVGDTVYVVNYTRNGYTIFECKIDEISHYSYGTFYHLNWGLHIPRFKSCKEDSFGKTVFLTKEEAEQALKEREQ